MNKFDNFKAAWDCGNSRSAVNILNELSPQEVLTSYQFRDYALQCLDGRVPLPPFWTFSAEDWLSYAKDWLFELINSVALNVRQVDAKTHKELCYALEAAFYDQDPITQKKNKSALIEFFILFDQFEDIQESELRSIMKLLSYSYQLGGKSRMRLFVSLFAAALHQTYFNHRSTYFPIMASLLKNYKLPVAFTKTPYDSFTLIRNLYDLTRLSRLKDIRFDPYLDRCFIAYAFSLMDTSNYSLKFDIVEPTAITGIKADQWILLFQPIDRHRTFMDLIVGFEHGIIDNTLVFLSIIRSQFGAHDADDLCLRNYDAILYQYITQTPNKNLRPMDKDLIRSRAKNQFKRMLDITQSAYPQALIYFLYATCRVPNFIFLIEHLRFYQQIIGEHFIEPLDFEFYKQMLTPPSGINLSAPIGESAQLSIMDHIQIQIESSDDSLEEYEALCEYMERLYIEFGPQQATAAKEDLIKISLESPEDEDEDTGASSSVTRSVTDYSL